MTDRQPDDLFDALRNRLADYGQEPPEALWASIRQQLPPPVAAPRRRRWAAPVLLGLLLAVVGGLSFLKWQGRPLPGLARMPTNAARTAPAASHSTEPANGQNRQVAGNKPVPGSAQASGEAQGADALAPVASRPAQPTGQVSASRHTPLVAQAAPAAGSELSAASSSRAGRPRDRASLLLAQGSRVGRLPRQYEKNSIGLVGSETGLAPSSATPRRTASAATSAAVPGSASATAGSQPVARPGSEGLPVAALPSRTPDEAATATPLPDNNASAQSRYAGTQPADAVAIRANPTESISPRAGAEDALAARSVVLLVPARSAAAVAAMPDTAARPVLQPARRWAVQLVAGPALTHRRLGRSDYAAASVRSSNARTFTSLDFEQTDAPSLERASVGAGAQVMAQRTLSGRWALGAGLGFHEYATQLVLKIYSAPVFSTNVTQLQNYASTQVRTRDTYRFLTVPLRLSYLLGRGTPRLSYGLTAGADLAWYVGGTTTEPTDCLCNTNRWGPTGSPYRPLSVTASLGLDFRYRMAPRWELLAQPTATYFLSSLTTTGPGDYSRHLLGNSLLLGASHTLR